MAKQSNTIHKHVAMANALALHRKAWRWTIFLDSTRRIEFVDEATSDEQQK